MTAYRTISTVLVTLVLTACATTEPAKPTSVDPDAIESSDVLGQLSPRALNAGQCALFLFTRDTPRRFVLFSRAGSNQADIILDEGEVTLPLVQAGGDIFGQFVTEQTFGNEDETFTLSLTPGEIIEDGQRIPVARLTRTMSDGWDVITPLQGVRACQPE